MEKKKWKLKSECLMPSDREYGKGENRGRDS